MVDHRRTYGGYPHKMLSSLLTVGVLYSLSHSLNWHLNSFELLVLSFELPQTQLKTHNS